MTMMTEELTKKEQIVKLAKEEPFLSIEDIAAVAETTERYARTVLSEAKISLLQIRKEAYEDLEALYDAAIEENFKLKEEVEELSKGA